MDALVSIYNNIFVQTHYFIWAMNLSFASIFGQNGKFTLWLLGIIDVTNWRWNNDEEYGFSWWKIVLIGYLDIIIILSDTLPFSYHVCAAEFPLEKLKFSANLCLCYVWCRSFPWKILANICYLLNFEFWGWGIKLVTFSGEGCALPLPLPLFPLLHPIERLYTQWCPEKNT